MTLAENRDWRIALSGLFALAVLTAAGGDIDMPPDGHEAYVLQTAREMHARGDWLLPYFNGAPRLNKPPLSYWLTAVSAQLASGVERIEPWHGRLPSVVAALGMLAMTLFIGVRLFDRPTALLAGLLLATSSGYFAYAHDARPDMLYAFWCSGALAALVGALTAAQRGAATVVPAVLMWLCFALATLTKGPQVPAMLLVAALWIGRRHGIGRVLHSVKGLLLMAALTLPWWWLVQQRLGVAAIAGSQLGGTLLRAHLRQFLDPYYLYATLQLLLPWLVLVPAAIALPFRSAELARGARLLGLPVVIALLLFSLGAQKRWFYMLPFLPAMCLLMAGATLHSLRYGWLSRVSRWLVPLHVLPAIGLLLWWAVTAEGLSAIGRSTILASAIACALLAAAAWRRRLTAALPVFAVLGLAGASVYANPALSGMLWSRERFEQARLAQTAAQAAGNATPLAVLDLNPDVFSYYLANRPVMVLSSLDGVARLAADSPYRQAILVLRTNAVASLPATVEREILAQKPGKPSAALSVLRLRARER